MKTYATRVLGMVLFVGLLSGCGGGGGSGTDDGAAGDATTSDMGAGGDDTGVAADGTYVYPDGYVWGALPDGFALPGNHVLCNGHVCQCSDGLDNDMDGLADALDPECVSPFDDDESSFATGIPGDNHGANAMTECFFDGDSGPGNDRDCIVPNGCDCRGCCDFNIDRSGGRERVNIRDPACHIVARTTTPNVEGGPCTPSGDAGPGSCTGAGQRCLRDGSGLYYFCAPCTPCLFANEEMPPLRNCNVNPCDPTRERCIGDPPPTGGPDAGAPLCGEAGRQGCVTNGDCMSLGSGFFCITGCCEYVPG
jgi:hypothetical protein